MGVARARANHHIHCRCNGLVGYSPAALIRRRDSGDIEHIYESEKSIYEGLNIHRPPPRR